MVALMHKAGRGLCVERYCRNLRRKDRSRCHTCDTRRKRKRNPMRYAFQTLRDHAAARGIRFTLLYAEFRKFALESDYLNRKGSDAHCLTVDRKDNLRGYVRGNIQPLTRSANSMKRAHRDAIRMRCGYKWQEKYETNGSN